MDGYGSRHLLGIRSELDGVVIDPCIPKDWKEITISRGYQGKKLNVTVKNPDGMNKGVHQLEIDGNIFDGNFISKDFVTSYDGDSIEIIAYM